MEQRAKGHTWVSTWTGRSKEATERTARNNEDLPDCRRHGEKKNLKSSADRGQKSKPSSRDEFVQKNSKSMANGRDDSQTSRCFQTVSS